MKINPGPKGLLPWTEAEKAEGLRLSQGGLSPIEVYSSLMIERIKRYEEALTSITQFAPGNGDVCEQIARTSRYALYPELKE